MSEILFNSIASSIIDGDVANVKIKVQTAIDRGIPAKEILNQGLLVGMDEVGVLFKEGELFVPEVLVSAKAMHSGLDLIKTMLIESGVESKGKILTVTVEGDLHDIGVKLVGMMMQGAGFEVINIGVDVDAQTIVKKVKEINPDILGMSAMLTTTMTKMKDVIDLLKEEGLLDKTKIMIGGAPTSPIFAEKIGAHYSADASQAVSLAKKLIESN